MPSLEERISALEARISPQGEANVPTYLTVNPVTGAVTALFTGGVLINEQTPAPPPLTPTNAIAWQDSAGVVQSWVQGFKFGAGHQLLIEVAKNAVPQLPPSIQELWIADPTVVGGAQSAVQISTTDTQVGHAAAAATIFDSWERSDFLIGGGQAITTTRYSQPVRALGTVYTPNVNRPTLVTMNIAVSTAGGGTVDTVSVNVGAITVGIVLFRAFGATPGRADAIIPFTFFVPTNATYQAFISTNAGNVGFPNINSTTELAL